MVWLWGSTSSSLECVSWWTSTKAAATATTLRDKPARKERKGEMRWDIKLKEKKKCNEERATASSAVALLLIKLRTPSTLSSFALVIIPLYMTHEVICRAARWLEVKEKRNIWRKKNKSTKRTERISCRRRRRSVRWLSSSHAHTWWRRRRRRCVEERREVKYKNKSPYSMPTSENTSRIMPKSRADQSWRLQSRGKEKIRRKKEFHSRLFRHHIGYEWNSVCFATLPRKMREKQEEKKEEDNFSSGYNKNKERKNIRRRDIL